jgi:hypothetical protein
MNTIFQKISIFLLLFVATATLLGQENYTDQELVSFANIYMESKEIKSRYIRQTEKLYAIYDSIDKDRIHEILEAQLIGERIQLSDNEETLINLVLKRNRDLNKYLQQEQVNLCDSLDLSYDLYARIHDQYRTDIAFQRSLHPYIIMVINANISDEKK